MEEGRAGRQQAEFALGLLFGLLLLLKLTHVVGWSWWWITAPLWGGVVLWLLAAIIITVMFVISCWQTRL